MKTPFAILIRGPLGAGKTTVSHALAHDLGAEVISIDAIPLIEQGWDGGSEALFLRGNIVAAERGRAHLSKGTAVIFDGCFYWPRVIADLAQRLPVPLSIFTLKVPLDVCKERDRGRKLSYGEDSACAVFAKVAPYGKETPVDGTRSVPASVVAIRSALIRP